MKVLVLGAGGMAGHVITIRLQELGYRVIGLARKKMRFCETIVCDVRDKEKFETIIVDGKFDIIVNAIGLLLNNANENVADAIYINSYLPHFLVEITRNKKTRVISISTDCIFDGKTTGNYNEGSLSTAFDYYGRTKSLGELNDDKNLTFRTSIIGPDINEKGIGLFNWFMKQEDEINGFTKAIWTGVTTIILANAIDIAIQQNLVGLYQLVNNVTINKYKLLLLLNNLRINEVQINKSNNYVIDKSLINTRSDFEFNVPTYEDMIVEVGEWVRKHKEHYSNYRGVLK